MRPTLPAGWQWVPLSRLVSKIEAGKSFKCDERPPVESEHGIVKVSAVTWGTYDEQESKTITDAEKVNEANLIRPGDFLFSRANTLQLVGACVLVSATRKRLLLSDKILRLVMPDGLKPWLLWFLRSADGRRQIEALSTGNQESMRNIGQERIGQIEVPLPAEPTMQRIVSRIEELFSEIDEGERALQRVGRLVERYRQSVLKAAVTGGLTGGTDHSSSVEQRIAAILQARRSLWRADRGQAGAYSEPSPVSGNLDLPLLPEGWTWASMDQIGLVSGGLTKNRGRADRELRRPYLRVANVYANRLDLDDVHQIGVSDVELARVTLKKGDLLVVEGNGSVGQIGRVALWDGSIPDCVHQNHLIKLRCTALVPSWYVLVWCLSPLGRRYIERVASSSSGLHTLSISKIQSLPVPVPPEDVLDRIRDEFARMDAATASVLATLGDELRRATALRQAVLKAAFSGQLVPQDPGDEPAAALLARLAAQAAGAPIAPKRGGRPRRQPTTT